MAMIPSVSHPFFYWPSVFKRWGCKSFSRTNKRVWAAVTAGAEASRWIFALAQSWLGTAHLGPVKWSFSRCPWFPYYCGKGWVFLFLASCQCFIKGFLGKGKPTLPVHNVWAAGDQHAPLVFSPFLWPFQVLFYDTGFPAAPAWWPQLVEPKWKHIFTQDESSHLTFNMRSVQVTSSACLDLLLCWRPSETLPFSLWRLQGRGDPQQMWYRCGHLPVVPAPHHPAHDCGLPAVFNRHPAGQLFWETPGYFGPSVKV